MITENLSTLKIHKMSQNQHDREREAGRLDPTAIYLVPDNDVDVSSAISTHNTSTNAHADIRLLIEGLTTRLNALANSDDTTLDQMSEIVAYIKSNKTLIEEVTTNKVNVSDIINNLTTNITNKPLSAAQGVVLKGLIDAIKVPTKVSELTNDKGYITSAPVTSVNNKTGAVELTASDVGADASGTANSVVSTHNTNTSAHNDIRLLIEGLTTRLNALADSDDTTLDQMSEIVTYIKSNKSLIEGITTSKVNVSDIINNLTTNASNKPLSAAQGVALKSLIDAIVVPTKVSQLTNDKGYITSAPVTSVNNKTGAVELTASDVGALPSTTSIPSKLSDLTADSTHRLVTDTEKSTWNNKANKSEGAFFIEGSGTTDTSSKISTWIGTSDRITSYYDGLTIRYKIGVAGQSTTTLNINGLGAKTIYLFNTTKLTTQFPVNSIINLIYHEDLNSGCWVCSDYDSNTNTYQRVYPTTTNAEYPITARYNTTTGSNYYAEYGRYSAGVTLNPSTNTITATNFKGTATKATQDASGNVITSTYETKADATTKLNDINTQISQLSSEIVDLSSDSCIITDYVKTEAEEVISKVVGHQGSRTFNIAIMTDLHNNGGVSDVNILHACQGIGYIADRIKLDAVACLGDHTDSSGSSDWGECLADILACNNHKRKYIKNTDVFELMGNHDFKSNRSPMTHKTISAFSEGVVWGNRLGGYFYKDYDDFKLRIISLNTSETSWIGVSAEQYNWFIETLDLSSKEDATEWQTLILSHVPLDWSTFNVFVYVLKAYINGTNWTNGTYSCDYTGKNQATVIGCVHGHIHNFLVDKLYLGDPSSSTEQIDLYRIAIPEVTESYGNHYSAPYKHDTKYSKTANTGDDTSFNVLCIDLDNHIINAVCYGAGVDRVVNYADFTNGDEPTTYTNLIPTSIDTDGSVYNGIGYKPNTRLNSSGNAVEATGIYCTGFMPCATGDYLYFDNTTFTTATYNYINVYDANKTLLKACAIASIDNVYTTEFDNSGNVTKIRLGNATGEITNAAYFRVSATLIDDTSIITVNQPIGESETVNLLSNALTPNDITTVFDGVGYKNGYYASAAEPFYNTDAAFFCAGLMPIPTSKTFYIKGCTMDTSLSHTRFGFMREDGTSITAMPLSSFDSGAIIFKELGTQYYSVSINYTYNGEAPYYFYFSASGTGDNVIVSATPINIGYTNLADPTVTTDTTITTASQGWLEDVRINSTKAIVSATGFDISNIVPIGSAETVRIKGMTLSGVSYGRIYFYSGTTYLFYLDPDVALTRFTSLTTEYAEITVSELLSYLQGNSEYETFDGLRFGGKLSTTKEDVVITLDEEIDNNDILLNLNRDYVLGPVGESITSHLNESKAYLNTPYTNDQGFIEQACTASNITENSVTVTEPGIGGICVAYPIHLEDIGTQAYRITFDYSGTGKCRSYYKYATSDGTISSLVALKTDDTAGASGSVDLTIPASSGYEWLIIYLTSNTGNTKTFTNVSLTKA